MTTPCLLLIDPPASGAWNMAVDEALLDRASAEGAAALRFYQWSEATVSLGYAQRYADREHHAASRETPAVRRLSGGGALVHDRELTYSLCLPAGAAPADRAAALYEIVHEAIIESLGLAGVHARLYGGAAESPAAPEPFLCFARRSRHDIVLASPDGGTDRLTKIVGSAQRRSRGAVLQHGAVLLEASPRAPELPGIREMAGRLVGPDELIEPWVARLATRLNLSILRDQPLPKRGRAAAERLMSKYAGEGWTKRR